MTDLTRLERLSVHVGCGQLRGEVEIDLDGEPKWWRQGCRCRPAKRWPRADVSSLYDLCELCARGTAGGISRWAWLACTTCRDVVRSSDDPSVALLPIGRHSIMNQRYVKAGADAARVRVQTASLTSSFAGWRELHRWREQEARRLAQAFPGVKEVPYLEWHRVHPPSTAASEDAIARFRALVLDRRR